MNDVTFKELIKVCEKVGWEKMINELEGEAHKLEILQADLFAGLLLK